MPSSTGLRRPIVADRTPVTLRAYRHITAAAMPLAPFLLARRLKRGKEHPQRMAERRGEASLPRPEGPLIWAHGASVGEMVAVLPLIERLQARGLSVLVTSGTVNSARLAETRLSAGALHQFAPVDAPQFIARFLDHWRPDLGLFAESDLWPNLIMSCSERELPLILVNGRLSARSFSRWRYAPATIRSLLNRFDLCLAQSELDASRFSELGAPRVSLTGNLKLDVPAPPADQTKLASLMRAIGGRPVVAGASTHAGEEKLLIDSLHRLRKDFPELLTIIIPRHPERGMGIFNIAKLAGLNAALRSRGELPSAATSVYIADTIGELGLFYRAAPVVFMGGSLVRHGGQNPIEAAKLGATILHGPHVWNFRDIYAALDEAEGASLVSDPSKLALAIATWLRDEPKRRLVSERAAAAVGLLSGALQRTLSALEPYIMQLSLERR